MFYLLKFLKNNGLQLTIKNCRIIHESRSLIYINDDHVNKTKKARKYVIFQY